jgi:hypothetical protein
MSAFALASNGAMVNLGGAAGTVRDGDVANYELLGAYRVVGATVGGNSYDRRGRQR